MLSLYVDWQEPAPHSAESDSLALGSFSSARTGRSLHHTWLSRAGWRWGPGWGTRGIHPQGPLRVLLWLALASAVSNTHHKEKTSAFGVIEVAFGGCFILFTQKSMAPFLTSS